MAWAFGFGLGLITMCFACVAFGFTGFKNFGAGFTSFSMGFKGFGAGVTCFTVGFKSFGAGVTSFTVGSKSFGTGCTSFIFFIFIANDFGTGALLLATMRGLGGHTILGAASFLTGFTVSMAACSTDQRI